MKEYLRHIAANLGVLLVILTAFFMLCLLLSGCKQQAPLVQVREVLVHDTVQIVDSVWRDRVQYVKQKGDTVFKVDSVFLYKYKYLDKVKEVTVRDTIPYEVVVEKPVRQRSGYDRFVSWGFWSLLVLILGTVAWKIVKAVYLRKA